MPAYSFMRLRFRKQWRMLVGLKSFWITLSVSILEFIALAIMTYAALVNWGLKDLMILYSVTYACRCLALIAVYGVLKHR